MLDNSIVRMIWNKARIVPRFNPALYRQDACGAWITFQCYGDRDSPYGWEIDHIVPVTNGGSDNLSNLQPLHWKNNAAKGDGPLQCALTASA